MKIINRKKLMYLGVAIIIVISIYFNIMWADFIYYAEGVSLDYDVLEVIQKAKDKGYAIRIDLSSDICNNSIVESCLGLGVVESNYEYINVNKTVTNYDNSWSISPKWITVKDHGIVISIMEDYYEFGTGGKYTGFSPKRNMFSWEAIIIITNELRPLGISVTTPIQFSEVGYPIEVQD